MKLNYKMKNIKLGVLFEAAIETSQEINTSFYYEGGIYSAIFLGHNINTNILYLSIFDSLKKEWAAITTYEHYVYVCKIY